MLTPKELRWVYSNFPGTPTTYDCGEKCRHDNGGIPCCCDREYAVPIIYTSERDWLLKHSTLWHRFRAKDECEKEIVKDLDDDNVPATCQGVKKCEREWRSICCRIFPYYPYFDDGENIVGLIYNDVLGDKCWLHDRPEDVNKEYVIQSMEVWELIFIKIPTEMVQFVDHSKQVRRTYSRKGKPILIITPDGIKRMPYRYNNLETIKQRMVPMIRKR